MSQTVKSSVKPLTLGNYPTPVYSLKRVIQETSTLAGRQLWIKRDDYSGVELSGNKTRKLDYVLSEALDQGAQVILTAGALQSNHCRATVAACRKLGLTPHLLLFGSQGKAQGGNLLLDELMGAVVSYVDYKDYDRYLEIMHELENDYANQGIKSYCIPIGASFGLGNFGYIDSYREIKHWQETEGISLDAIVCAVGSGGTYAGLWLGHYLLKGKNAFEKTAIIGFSVSADTAYFKHKVLDILEQTCEYEEMLRAIDPNFNKMDMLETADKTIVILDGFRGEGYAIPYLACQERITWLAKLEGVVLDSVYTGKAFHGMMSTWESQEVGGWLDKTTERVLFVHTGGIFGAMGYGPQGNTLK